MPDFLRIHKNIDEGPRPGWKLFLYGDWGAGKTVLARSAPNSLLIDTDGSRISLLNHPELANLPYIEAETPEAMLAIAEKIKQGSPGFAQFDTYIVDTVSAVRSTSITSSVMRLNGRNVASQAEYNEANQYLSQLVMVARTVPNKNWIFIGHMALEKNPSGQVISTRPSLGEAAIQTFGQNCDVVMYLRAREASTGKTERELLTFKTPTTDQGNITAKDRLGLPNSIKNPTGDELFKLIEDQHKRKVTQP